LILGRGGEGVQVGRWRERGRKVGGGKEKGGRKGEGDKGKENRKEGKGKEREEVRRGREEFCAVAIFPREKPRQKIRTHTVKCSFAKQSV